MTSSDNKSSAGKARALEVAKKILLNDGDSGVWKLKKLVQKVATEIGDDSADTSQIKKWIKESGEMFGVNDQKYVTLKDQAADETAASKNENNKSSKDTSSKKKKKKKDKKRKKEESATTLSTDDKKKKKQKVTTSTSSDTNSDVDHIGQWRKEHKIIVKATPASADDDKSTVIKRTKELNADITLFPHQTFESGLKKAGGDAHDNDGLQSCLSKLLNHCTNVKGFQKPSPIQAQCWPILLSTTTSTAKKRDVVGIAETGSGKTLAFAIPALAWMASDNNNSSNKHRRRRTPRLLVLAPTRELAHQSHQVLEEFGPLVGMTSLVIYGGVPKHTQTVPLKRDSIDCVVGTPGRLLDLCSSDACDLSNVRHLVLDEADRMLDMGFEEDVRQIISYCAPMTERQTAMFSATWPAAIQKLAMQYMQDPIRVYVGFESLVSKQDNGGGENGESNSSPTDDNDMEVDDSLSANRRVTQIVEVVEDRAREGRLRQLLKEHKAGRAQHRILIFALYKKEAERLEYQLKNREGYGDSVCSIHGNKNQAARTHALAQFKNGTCPLMVATDVAARGLDIPNVEVVINYTFPLTIEDYVHRIGRTGRAGKKGISHTFFQPTDKGHAGALQQVMKQAGQDVPEELKKFGSTIKRKEHKLYGNFGPSSSGAPMKKATKITFNYD